MTDPIPPPVYSQMAPDVGPVSQAGNVSGTTPQILIIPTGNAVNFQTGFLGAEDERAAIEGELQLKAVDHEQWAKVTIALRVVEAADGVEIELGASEILLHARTPETTAPLPTSLPFSIPLMPDAPQSIQTSMSSLSYVLTATLHPFDSFLPTHSTALSVHTRRYTSHTHTVSIHPENFTLKVPTTVDVQVPRTTYTAGESIPVYVTVPPPPTDLVVQQGLRLRNVRAELVRIVTVKKAEHDDFPSVPALETIAPGSGETSEVLSDGPSSIVGGDISQQPSSKVSPSLGSSHRTIIARSGASCRFHASRPIKLRFVLHQAVPLDSPSRLPSDLSGGGSGQYDIDAKCPSITQVTILHSISFLLFIYVSFVDITTRRERISAVQIPITVLAPPAPLPQVSQEVDVAYQKKHDRPPLKTVRQEDSEHPIPHYTENEAGPSILPSSAPPPFEERDAPPPFSVEVSTSTRLPTFLESESEIIVPPEGPQSLDNSFPSPIITGEGLLFGFLSSDQFDGHTEPVHPSISARSITPPPTMEMSAREADPTIHEPIEALGLVLDPHDANVDGERPPPPPAMDDPSDPPPCIDSAFRSPDRPRTRSSSHGSSRIPQSYGQSELSPSTASSPTQPVSADGYAPPPYLVPVNHNDQETVTRPPPYMD